MDFQLTKEAQAIRDEARDFVRKEWKNPGHDLTGGLAAWHGDEDNRHAGGEIAKEFAKKLVDKGWYTMHWPKEFGGEEASIEKQLAYREVMSYEDAPASLGGGLVAPVLMVHGADWMKQEFLPKLASADIEFSQGFSEPDAGSDLAGLKTRAVRDGDDYVINGQKIWGTYRNDWIHILVRTDSDAPKHRGITYLLARLKDENGDYMPGITVRGIPDGTGNHRWDELFMENWRVPAQSIIGEENRGWYAAMTTLSFERSNIGRPAQLLRTLEDTIDWFEANSKKGTEDTLARAEIRNRLASWRVEVEMLRMLCYRVGWMQSQGLVPQRESSMVKATGDELFQRIYRGIAQIMGGYGNLLPTNGPNYKLPVNDFLPARGWQSIGTSIGGGTREIQKNIIAQRGLGLPR
ncbi:MAG: acyl-CoA dehydrogenase family protein [Dehalococcoidia bacterium]